MVKKYFACYTAKPPLALIHMLITNSLVNSPWNFRILRAICSWRVSTKWSSPGGVLGQLNLDLHTSHWEIWLLPANLDGWIKPQVYLSVALDTHRSLPSRLTRCTIARSHEKQRRRADLLVVVQEPRQAWLKVAPVWRQRDRASLHILFDAEQSWMCCWCCRS